MIVLFYLLSCRGTASPGGSWADCKLVGNPMGRLLIGGNELFVSRGSGSGICSGFAILY